MLGRRAAFFVMMNSGRPELFREKLQELHDKAEHPALRSAHAGLCAARRIISGYVSDKSFLKNASDEFHFQDLVAWESVPRLTMSFTVHCALSSGK